jgi:MFS family permease
VKLQNLYPFALACLMVAIAYKLYVECIYLLGFPDGFIAELDGAEARLAAWFNWFCLAMAVWFVALGWWSFRAGIKRKLACSCVLFLFVTAAAIALDLYFRSYMTDAAGG